MLTKNFGARQGFYWITHAMCDFDCGHYTTHAIRMIQTANLWGLKDRYARINVSLHYNIQAIGIYYQAK